MLETFPPIRYGMSHKLSDFIFSMSIPEGKTQVENEGVCETKRYLAPKVF